MPAQWAAYPMLQNTGFLDSNNGTNYLKAAFCDFLKIRHGGTVFCSVGVLRRHSTPSHSRISTQPLLPGIRTGRVWA